MNRLIWVAAERPDAFAAAALATAACVHTATQNGEHEDKATHEDVRPIACYQTLEVLFLLGGRNWGVRLLRGREEGIRGRACTVHAGLDKVGERGGRVGYGEQLDIGIAAIAGCIRDEISIIKERIKVAHYAMRENRGMNSGKVMRMKYTYRHSCQESCHRIQAC